MGKIVNGVIQPSAPPLEEEGNSSSSSGGQGVNVFGYQLSRYGIAGEVGVSWLVGGIPFLMLTAAGLGFLAFRQSGGFQSSGGAQGGSYQRLFGGSGGSSSRGMNGGSSSNATGGNSRIHGMDSLPKAPVNC